VRLVVGLAEAVPKLIAKRLLSPLLTGELGDIGVPLQLVCREDATDRLLEDLAAHRLDAVVLDTPLPPGTGIRAFNHPLGETPMVFFASKKDARSLRSGFPKSLDGAPMLLPTSEAAVRRSLDTWFHAEKLSPKIVAEFDDSALLKVFAQDGLGVFAGPEAIADEIATQYGVEPIGRVPSVKERFYLVTMQRRVENPAVRALLDYARSELFRMEEAPAGRLR
jgi:LysR family transcriptional activator of nhaA